MDNQHEGRVHALQTLGLIKTGLLGSELIAGGLAKHFGGNALSEFGRHVPGLPWLGREVAASGFRRGQAGIKATQAAQHAGAVLGVPAARDAYSTGNLLGRMLPHGTTSLPNMSGQVQGLQEAIEQMVAKNPNASLHSTLGKPEALAAFIGGLEHQVPAALQPQVGALRGMIENYVKSAPANTPISQFYSEIKPFMTDMRDTLHFYENMPIQAGAIRRGLDKTLGGLGTAADATSRSWAYANERPLTEVGRDIQQLFKRRGADAAAKAVPATPRPAPKRAPAAAAPKPAPAEVAAAPAEVAAAPAAAAPAAAAPKPAPKTAPAPAAAAPKTAPAEVAEVAAAPKAEPVLVAPGVWHTPGTPGTHGAPTTSTAIQTTTPGAGAGAGAGAGPGAAAASERKRSRFGRYGVPLAAAGVGVGGLGMGVMGTGMAAMHDDRYNQI